MKHKANELIWAIMKEKGIHLHDLAIICNVMYSRMSRLMQTEMSAERQLFVIKRLYGIEEEIK